MPNWDGWYLFTSFQCCGLIYFPPLSHLIGLWTWDSKCKLVCKLYQWCEGRHLVFISGRWESLAEFVGCYSAHPRDAEVKDFVLKRSVHIVRNWRHACVCVCVFLLLRFSFCGLRSNRAITWKCCLSPHTHKCYIKVIMIFLLLWLLLFKRLILWFCICPAQKHTRAATLKGRATSLNDSMVHLIYSGCWRK